MGKVVVVLDALPFTESAPLVALLVIVIVTAVIGTMAVVVTCWIVLGRR